MAYYNNGDIAFDIKNILDALKGYLVLQEKLRDVFKDQEYGKQMDDARTSFNKVAGPHARKLVEDMKTLQEVVKPKEEYVHSIEFEKAIDLIKGAGEDEMPIDVLMQFAEKFKDNKAYIDLMISTAKNIETKNFFERFKRNRVVDFEEAMADAVYISITPMQSLERVGSISTLFKRLASLDDKYKQESEKLSDLFFEIHSIYANGHVPVV